jgi:hypothetical protein
MRNRSRRGILALALTTVMIAGTGAQAPPAVDVFKTPTCGCCAKWVEHLRGEGFAVKTTELANLTEVKAKHRVPMDVQTCHTAIVGGYVIEGHVPAADIKRLLKERPAVVGLAVPGMPIGSPGMEGAVQNRYDVLSFDKQGTTRVFSTHGR